MGSIPSLEWFPGRSSDFCLAKARNISSEGISLVVVRAIDSGATLAVDLIDIKDQPLLTDPRCPGLLGLGTSRRQLDSGRPFRPAR